MSTLLAIALAASVTNVQPECSWDRPGANPYTGTVQEAIDRYTDIPAETRRKLKRRMEYGNPDEMVDITRDAIRGKHAYSPTIRDMHFGPAQMCHAVTRAKWAAARVEAAAVYCVEEHCIIVPTICGNVSRITRLAPATTALPHREREREMVAQNWGEYAGSYELGLIDAPAEEDLDADSEAVRQLLAFNTPADSITHASDDTGTRQRRQTLAATDAPDKAPLAGEAGAVTAVPEPESWAMLLGGLGLVGYLARRQRRRTDSADSTKTA